MSKIGYLLFPLKYSCSNETFEIDSLESLSMILLILELKPGSLLRFCSSKY